MHKITINNCSNWTLRKIHVWTVVLVMGVTFLTALTVLAQSSGGWSTTTTTSGNTRTTTTSAYGSMQGPPHVTTSPCCGGGNAASNNDDDDRPSPPSVTISANPTTVWPGEPFTLTWRALRATSCTASGAWTGPRSLSGSESVTARTTPGTSQYTLSCRGGGGTRSDSVTVRAQAPTLSLSVNQSLLRRGDSATVSWDITPDPRTEPNTSCVITGVVGSPYDVTTTAANSVSTGPIINGRVVTLTCDIYGITYTEQVLLEVVPSFFEG